MCLFIFVFFFFFKQKTAYEMRISDWSSDVCSSDLRRRITVRPAMALQIQLLGGFFAQRDGRPLALSSRKVAALLAILACQPGALHSRARLADLLWSRSAEAQARGSLRQALRQLRKDLDSPDGPVREGEIGRASCGERGCQSG